MNYREIELLVKENKLETILKNLEDTFIKIDSRTQKLMSGAYTNGQDVDKLLMKCTGFWDYLNTIYIILDTIKDHQEVRLFNKIKMEEVKKKQKIVAAVIDKAVSEQVMTLRRVRNIVGAYRDTCDKNIFSCQSLLKSLNDNYKRTRD